MLDVKVMTEATLSENDVRLAAGTLWRRRFELPWMIRLHAAGAPVTWMWTLATYLLTLLAVAWIWAGPLSRRGTNREERGTLSAT